MHLSIDFWGTIARSNQLRNFNFRNKFVEYLSTISYCDADFIKEKVDHVSNFHDWFVEVNDGQQFLSRKKIVQLLCFELHIDNKKNIHIFDQIENNLDKLFWEFPPVLINKELPNLLNQWQLKGNTFNISSNTNFVVGENIESFLNSNLIHPDFSIYSDNVEFYKPFEKFFYSIIENLTSIKRKTDPEFFRVKQDSLIHIGDNDVIDRKFAENAGIRFELITEENDIVKVLTELLQKND